MHCLTWSICLSRRWFHVYMEQIIKLCFSSFQCDQPSNAEAGGGGSRIDHCSSNMVTKPWFPRVLRHLVGPPLELPRRCLQLPQKPDLQHPLHWTNWISWNAMCQAGIQNGRSFISGCPVPHSLVAIKHSKTIQSVSAEIVKFNIPNFGTSWWDISF